MHILGFADFTGIHQPLGESDFALYGPEFNRKNLHIARDGPFRNQVEGIYKEPDYKRYRRLHGAIVTDYTLTGTPTQNNNRRTLAQEQLLVTNKLRDLYVTHGARRFLKWDATEVGPHRRGRYEQNIKEFCD